LYCDRAMAEDRSDDHCDLLMPILVSGYGRVGSTALMALLGTDERVAFDRRYPFENRYLTIRVGRQIERRIKIAR
jgi:hypothetical protein